MKMAKEFYFKGVIKSVRMGNNSNRKFIKIDDIYLSSDLQEKVEDMKLSHQLDSRNPLFDIDVFFRNKKVKIILEE